jgi:hypothetical protein
MRKKTELWKLIPNTNSRYKISNCGQVYDIKNDRIIRPHMSGVERRNYPQVTLYVRKDGVLLKKTKRVHSLMAMTFLNFEYNGSRDFVVDHIDNNPLNNNLKNLQIVSMQINNTKDR